MSKQKGQGMKIAALSLWEPWATLMRIGVKRFETRSWPCPLGMIGKRLLICGAKRWTREQGDLLWSPAFRKALRGRGSADMLLGKAAAIVTLQDCLWIQTSLGLDWSVEVDFGDYRDGRWAWETGDLIGDFDPFPVTGRQGVFDVDLPEYLAERIALPCLGRPGPRTVVR